MTSADHPPAGPPADDGAYADCGLLAPVWAGTPAEAATGDVALLEAMLDGEAALTRAQAALGHAPAHAARAVTEAALEADLPVRELAVRARQSGNPVVPLVAELTAAVARTAPGAEAYVHRGATSQDILDTALMLVADRTLRTVRGDLARTADVLAALAAAHRVTPMAGRTLTQHAVPTTFGLKAAGWREVVLDAHDRVTALLADGLPAQLGGAAGTLAGLAAQAEAQPDAAGGPLELLEHFAAATGLAEPRLPWHTLRTPVADLAAVLAFTTGALGKIAADVLLLSRTETGEVAEAAGGPSSAMPHKANPVGATLIASAARQAAGPAATLQLSLTAEDERPAGAWHAEWQPLRELLRLAGGSAHLAAEIADGLRVFPDRMAGNLRLTGGLITAERVTAALEPALGRTRARQAVTAAAARTGQHGRPGLAEALASDDEVAAALTPERLAALTDPAGHLGCAPELTDRALKRTPRELP